MEMLKATAEVMQVELPSAPALRLLIGDFPSWNLGKWAAILRKARIALNTYGKFLTSAQLAELDKPSEDEMEAAARLAWEEALRYKKYLQYTPEYALPYIPKLAPPLDNRIKQAVRLVGGWERILQMNSQDWAFVQKEFIQHFKCYDAMNEVALEQPGLAGLPELKQLAQGKKMP